MRRLLALLACALAVAGCGRAQGVADTRRALEQAGYRDVEVTLKAGGGIGLARIDAAPEDAPPADAAAEVAWDTLPVRFDQLIVAAGPQTTSFSYPELERRFGPRDPSLDGRQIDQEVVEHGLRLMLVLTGAAIVSVGAVVAMGVVVLKTARRARAA